MDILNWLRIKKQNLIRTTLDSPKDLVMLGADVSFQKRGDKYQSYAMPAEDFLATAARPYKVYTALLTQSGGDGPSNINEGLLTIGVTYEVGDESPGWDFTNVGAPNNIPGTKFVATGTTPNSWGSMEGDPGITILIFNTGAPVVTVLENTIGNVWFTYVSDGNYYLESNGLFTADKTWTNPTSNDNGSIQFQMFRINNNKCRIIDSSGSNNGLINTSIEIRVYN